MTTNRKLSFIHSNRNQEGRIIWDLYQGPCVTVMMPGLLPCLPPGDGSVHIMSLNSRNLLYWGKSMLCLCGWKFP